MIEVITELPAIRRIQFDETDDNPERRALQRWKWHSLTELLACIHGQKKGLFFNEVMLVQSFAALNGHVEQSAVVTWVSKNKDGGHNFSMHVHPKAFRCNGHLWEHYIPAGWGMKILEATAKGIVEVRLQFQENKLAKVIGRFSVKQGGQTNLPLKLSPEITDWRQES